MSVRDIHTTAVAMDPSKKGRQTNIIDDLDAIALAMQGGKRKAVPKKKHNTGRTGPSALPAAGSSRAKPAKKPAATQDAGPRFYEKDGVKIPLFEKGGKKRPNARLSSTLRNKNTEFLLDVVEQYAGADKRKEFKDADKSKADMADWIEQHETHALGPNPNSKLNLVMPDPTKEPNIEDEDTPRAISKPATNDVKVKRKGKAPAQFLEFDHGTKPKRKRDNTSEPAQAPEQTTKRSKIHHAIEQLAKQSPTGQRKVDILVEDEPRESETEESLAESKKPDMMPTLSDEEKGRLEEEETREKDEERLHDNYGLQVIMEGLGMHPGNRDTSSMVVQLPEQVEDRVLTASTNRWTGAHILHDTPISHHRDQRNAQPAPSDERPFLKAGKHARSGDFDNDFDRRTGLGHQVNPEDQEHLDDYLSFRGQILKKYPRYPSADAGEDMHPEVKKVWDKNELWNCNFSNKYSGYTFNHIWPCGCEKVKGESGDEESEDEDHVEVKAFRDGKSFIERSGL